MARHRAVPRVGARVLSCLVVIACLPRPATGATAKATDKNEDFKYYSRVFLRCVDNCLVEGCAHVTHRDVNFTTGGCVPLCTLDGSTLKPGQYPPEFTLPMRLTGWDCGADCKYRCTRTVVRVRAHEGLNTAKYYGKWSFQRVLRVQEFVSMTASLANAGVHVWFLPELGRVAFGKTLEMENSPSNKNDTSSAVNRGWAFLWFANGVTQLHGWIWSAVFHTRDTPLTHVMDYGSANLIFFVWLFAAVCRTFAIEKKKILPLFLLFAAATVAHLKHVNRRQEDGTKYHFKFNMRAMIAMATTTWGLLLWWAFGGKVFGAREEGGKKDGYLKKKRTDEKTRGTPHPGRGYLARCCFVWHVSALAEVLDFPPLWGVLDAHALWHCGTPYTVWLWYQFVRVDVWAEKPKTK